jgi:hypothetical protein
MKHSEIYYSLNGDVLVNGFGVKISVLLSLPKNHFHLPKRYIIVKNILYKVRVSAFPFLT